MKSMSKELVPVAFCYVCGGRCEYDADYCSTKCMEIDARFWRDLYREEALMKQTLDDNYLALVDGDNFFIEFVDTGPEWMGVSVNGSEHVGIGKDHAQRIFKMLGRKYGLVLDEAS